MGWTVNFVMPRKSGFVWKERCRWECARGQWGSGLPRTSASVQVVPFSACLSYCLNIHSCFLANVWIQFTLRHLPILALNWFPIVITWWLQVIRFPSHLPTWSQKRCFSLTWRWKLWYLSGFFIALSFSVPAEAAILPSGSGIPHPSRLLHSSTFLPPAPSLAKLCLQWAHSARW